MDKGQLERYENGVYYLAKESRLGGKAKLSANAVLRSRYIKDKGKVFGYISGIGLLNEVGLTTQVPNTYEVVTNREANTLIGEVGKFKVVLKKPMVGEVDNNTLPILKTLDLINYNQFTSLSLDEKKTVLKKIGVDKENIRLLTKLVGQLPDYYAS